MHIGDRSLNGYERDVLFRNCGDGSFDDVAYLTHCDRLEDGRAVAVADFDRDGRQDLLVQNYDRPAVLLMGRGRAGHWLELRLEGTRSNRDALGARAVAHVNGRKLARSVACGSGFMSSSSSTLHFGLGAATEVERLEIFWPAGGVQILERVPAGQMLVLREEPSASLTTAER